MVRTDAKARCIRGMQGGYALLELAAWAVPLLPLLMISTALIASSHERNVLQIIPEALIRETPGEVMTWSPDGAGGEFRADIGRLDQVASWLAERAVTEARANAFKLKNLSATGCYWVFAVDAPTGGVTNAVDSRCTSTGGINLQASLETVMRQKLETGIAEPIRVGANEVREYVPLVVLFGVAISGDFEGIGLLYPTETMQHASVWVPRRDVVL